MSQSSAFRMVSEGIERRTALDRLQSRGTLRIALRQAGLQAKSVSATEMAVVLERILPTELESRGVAKPEALCAALAACLHELEADPQAESPDQVFERLGGSTTGEER